MPKNLFQHLKKLCSLHFSDFQIEVMADSFYHLTELHWLILKRFSHLTKLQSLKECQKLMVVDLSGGASLSTFPEKNLESLLKLQTLKSFKLQDQFFAYFSWNGELTHQSVSGCSHGSPTRPSRLGLGRVITGTVPTVPIPIPETPIIPYPMWIAPNQSILSELEPCRKISAKFSDSTRILSNFPCFLVFFFSHKDKI